MKDYIVSARRAYRVDLPWTEDLRAGLYELTSGRRGKSPKHFKSPTTYACMDIRSKELANIPWHIKRNGKILEKHPLIDMLTDFGPESNWQQGIATTELDMFDYGAGIWLRDYDILKRLDPSTIEVKRTTEGITGFKQTLHTEDGTIERTFSRDEVIYFREHNPEDALGFGIPLTEVCQKSINAEIEALLMLEALFKNDAVPGLFLSSEQDISEKEAERVLSWWNRRFRGARNKGKVGIAGRGLKPTPIGQTMRETQIVELLEHVSRDICKAFRVDQILIGGNVQATYENLNESRRFLIEDVIMPRAVEYQNVINQDLVNLVDPKVEFEFAFDEMQILQEDSTAKQARLTEAYNLGIISEDYYREEMGYPADSKPDKPPEKDQIAEDKWEKKAVKAFLRGEDPNVPFETDNISIDRQYVLRGRLQNAKTEEAVRACFND